MSESTEDRPSDTLPGPQLPDTPPVHSADWPPLTPRLLFEQRYSFGGGVTLSSYDISPDGQGFVMIKEAPSANRLNVVFNWFEELKARVPAK